MLHRLTLLMVLVLALVGCGDSPPSQEDVRAPTSPPSDDAAADAALGEGLSAVATVYPLAALAEDIAPGADVGLLTASGQDPHDAELSPADRGLIESADVVLYMGDIDFQPQVEAAVADASGRVVAVAEIGEAQLLDFDGHTDDDGHGDDDEAGHGDDDEAGHDDEAAEEGHADAADAVDPHIWFDADVMAEVAEEIGEAFAAADPDRAEDYRAGAEAVHDELLALDEEIDALLSDCAYDTAFVSHEAYAYLLEPQGLEQEGISGAGGHGEASPQRLAELTERVRAEGIPAVLAEPVEGRADAEALVNETGVELLEIDPLEIGHQDLDGIRYPDALGAQAETFARALDCG